MSSVAIVTALAILITQLTSVVPASAGPPCPCTLFGTSTPTTPAFNDDDGVEVGVSFSPDTDGFVTGIRFYKGTGNTGTHYGHLWTENGDLLATTTFTSETSSGWQQANFGAAIELDANETYIASYWAPEGRYAINSNFFSSSHDAAPLHATTGVYRSGVAAGFPDATSSANYWVDVVFDTGTTPTDSAAPVVSSITPADDVTDVGVTSSVVLAFSESMNASSLNLSTISLTPIGDGNAVIADIGYDPLTNIASIDPYGPLASGTTYEIGLTTGVEDAAGNNLASVFTASFTTETIDLGEPEEEHRIFEGDTPATPATSDSNAVTLGTKFHAAIAGTITGISFYKGTGNTGTHTGALYDEAENVLASGTFTSETADGWQTLTFSQPVLINAGQTYIAAYFAPTGHYAHESGYFASDHTAGVLRVPKDGGVFRYGSSINFPQEHFGSSAYWVTPVFKVQDPDIDQVLFDAVTPDVTSASDSGSVNLGLKFAPLVDGTVTGVSFYKGTGNTGTHTGSLWTTTGTQLATGTFTSETPSGWQTLIFDEPVEVDANTIYVASYLAPNGHYAYSSSYFDGHSEVRASLLAPSAEISSGNGVYAYAGSTTFPTNSFNQTNYFVTPVFRPTVDTAPSELTAAFTATPTSGSEPLTVEVDASTSTSSAAITNYDWNFGDGATGTGQVAEHVYSVGTYTITLTVTDANNDTDTATEQITVSSAALSPSGTTRASTNTTGDDASDMSTEPSLSADGRYVAISSFASDIVSGDGNNARDVFLRNLVTGAVTRISTNPAVAPVNGNSGGESYAPKLSADGRYVVYLGAQRATTTDIVADAYLFDRLTNTTTLVSVPGTGFDPDAPVTEVAISGQGNRVAFIAFTDDGVAGTISHGRAVFMRDLGTGTTTQLTPSTTFSDGYFVTSPALSTDGRYVAFVSQDPSLATGASGQLAVYVHDMTTTTTEPISVDSTGDPVTDGFSSGPSISDDGRYIAFQSSSAQLVSGDDNGLVDVFLRDRTAETTIRVSVDTTADDGDGPSSEAKISGDGAHVVFTSTATNLTSADDSGIDDVFVRNLVTGTTTRVTNNTSDDEADGPSIAGSINNDGTRVAYVSLASDLIGDDENGFTDVYVWTE